MESAAVVGSRNARQKGSLTPFSCRIGGGGDGGRSSLRAVCAAAAYHGKLPENCAPSNVPVVWLVGMCMFRNREMRLFRNLTPSYLKRWSSVGSSGNNRLCRSDAK